MTHENNLVSSHLWGGGGGDEKLPPVVLWSLELHMTPLKSMWNDKRLMKVLKHRTETHRSKLRV